MAHSPEISSMLSYSDAIQSLLLCIVFLALTARQSGRAAETKSAPSWNPGARFPFPVHLTVTEAGAATREVLVAHGYAIMKVERVGSTEMIYYRRIGGPRVRGPGPVRRLVIRLNGNRVVFESTPSRVLVDVHVQLGL
jgi:hypothetical protein